MTFQITPVPAVAINSMDNPRRVQSALEANAVIAELALDSRFNWDNLAAQYLSGNRGLASTCDRIRHRAIVGYDDLRLGHYVYNFVRERVNLAIMTWIEAIVSQDIINVRAQRDQLQEDLNIANDDLARANDRNSVQMSRIENLEEALMGLLTAQGVVEGTEDYERARQALGL